VILNDRKRFECFLKHTGVHEIGPDCVQWCWRMLPHWEGVNIQTNKACKDQDREKVETDNNRGEERQER